MARNSVYFTHCTHTVPVARTDSGGAAEDVVALVAVLAVRVKPVVLEVVVAVVVAVFNCKSNPTINSSIVVFDASRLNLFKQQTIL
jgi:hypothetical protein